VSFPPHEPYRPDVAWDGERYLVVWDEYSGTAADVYGARISADGVNLDPDPIPISAAAEEQELSSVASNGTTFLATWEDERSGELEVYASRIDGDGTVLDPQGIRISPVPNAQWDPSVASNGDQYLVAWSDATEDRVYGSRVSAAGVVLDPDGIQISRATPTAAEYSETIWAGENYVVVWTDWVGDDAAGSRVTTEGQVLDPESIRYGVSTNEQSAGGIASDGENSFAVWTDFRAGLSGDIYGARIGPDGTTLDGTGILISGLPTGQARPTVAWDGQNFLVVWVDWRSGSQQLYGARVTPAGVVLDPGGILVVPTPGTNSSVQIAASDENFLVVWHPPSLSEVRGTRVSPDGVVLDLTGFLISNGSGTGARDGQVAWGAGNYLVTWAQGPYYEGDVYASRVTTSGVVLDPAGIPIRIAPGWQTTGGLAWGGSEFLVT
jgi:hypothetical protein